MTRSISICLLVVFTIMSTALIAQSGERELIAYWSFNEGAPATNYEWSFPVSADNGNASISSSFQVVRSVSGLTQNTTNSQGAGQCLATSTDTSDTEGYFTVSDLDHNYESLELSFASFRTYTGFRYARVYVSVDNENWSEVGNSMSLSTSAQVVSLSIPEIGGRAFPEYIKIRLYSAAGSGTNSNKIDNIQITGIPIQTLPVELSAFVANLSSNAHVGLTWISQSETNLLGYKVLRHSSSDLWDATVISPLIYASNTSQAQTYYWEDQEDLCSGVYYYWLQSLDYDGSMEYHGPCVVDYTAQMPGNPEPDLGFGVESVYPNPFNPQTTISYSLDAPGRVKIYIYNSRGQRVRSLKDDYQDIGTHRVVWDGTTDGGELCGSGLYRVQMLNDNQVSNHKIIMLK